jgi:hypothetical protein
MMHRGLTLLAAALLFAGCAGKTLQHASADASQGPKRLIASRGVVMPLADAVKTVDFVPFIPPAQIIAAAVVPPLSDAQGRRAIPGIAFEYENGGDALLLTQWVRGGLTIRVGGDDLTTRPCAPVAYQAEGLLWTTRNGRVMTLQPDGSVLNVRIAREVDRLLRAGACGRAVSPLSRSLRTPPRAVSSPQRSAF